ncbi:phosphoribosylformylglycinamidine synthase subunit PurQ [Geothrix sp. PMB-07]|uniref:phosphoribosylformylglycinamidine synthase subunit PurQ n=1 Tax=Geothrix sp. PMB-07 TaxID=3068640 RepID=UPI0027428DCC|nr:phosphoribosylformylglycinamidine synthase subunit PurQ [Geothrix sp. PMB-07]WLT32788.1 phosphoribosylformylglycinamidine synthase subunit PurQ [Geothrix sp. PMB-07]
MRVAVPVFPGSNCDHDALHACGTVMGWEAIPVWHQEARLPENTELVVVPGGFSYGDYLRCGAIAALAPIMADVKRHAENGGLVLGVCNGFQILCEAQLLPGALLRNESLRFIHKDVHLRVERADLPFTRAMKPGAVFQVPIAHAEGNFTIDPADLADLEARGGVAFRYCSPAGELGEAHVPNGAMNGIAGIVNIRGNVLGMMPHPERAVDPKLGPTGGLGVFQSLAETFATV